MPYVIPVTDGDYFEIRLTGFIHGQLFITTFRYELETGPQPDPVDMAPLATDFQTQVWEPLRELLSNEVVGVRINLQKIDPLRYVSFQLTPTATNGAVASSALPSTVAMVVKRKMRLAGRRQRGRIFIPGLPVASESDSQVSTAVQASAEMETFLENQIVQLTAGAGLLLTPSLIVNVGGAWVNRGDVEIVELDPILRVQRRREVGRGV